MKKTKKMLALLLVVMMTVSLTACGQSAEPEKEAETVQEPAAESAETAETEQEDAAEGSEEQSVAAEEVSSPFDRVLDDYEPQKDSYKIYFNYKNIHVWYDAIELGVQKAIEEYKEKGINIEYEWIAPTDPDAADQVNRIEEAVGRGFDVICVEPSNLDLVAPSITNIVDNGTKVLCFGATDLTGYEESSGRSAFIGQSDPYQDGVLMAEIFCEEIGYAGKVANLGGSIGAPGHEAINQAFYDTIAKYPDIELVDTQYDNDELDKAIQYTENFLQKYNDLAGIFCNNMTNPIGAAQAVTAAGKAGDIVIVGYDHDIQALEYLRDGTIYSLGICDCFGVGFDTLLTAIKVADGCEAGTDFDEIQPYPVGAVYQDQAEDYINTLYPDHKG